MKFKFQADAEIEAESHADAFAQLAAHFHEFAMGNKTSSMQWVGMIGLRAMTQGSHELANSDAGREE